MSVKYTTLIEDFYCEICLCTKKIDKELKFCNKHKDHECEFVETKGTFEKLWENTYKFTIFKFCEACINKDLVWEETTSEAVLVKWLIYAFEKGIKSP